MRLCSHTCFYCCSVRDGTLAMTHSHKHYNTNVSIKKTCGLTFLMVVVVLPITLVSQLFNGSVFSGAGLLTHVEKCEIQILPFNIWCH